MLSKDTVDNRISCCRKILWIIRFQRDTVLMCPNTIVKSKNE